MKRLMILFVVILLLIPAAMVNAQEPLEPGTPVRGEITDDAFEVEYTFSGTADSVVIIEMLAQDEEGFMTDLTAQVILLDSSGSVVVDTSDNFVFSDAVLVTTLPADDDYTIVATREDGRAGETTGGYSIEVVFPDVLAAGDSIEGSASSETGTEYYVVDSETDFVLTYEKSSGDYDPEVRITTIADNNSDFEDYAVAGGNLDNITMGDMDAGLYIVQIGEALFSFYFDEVTADYMISVNSVE